LVTSIILLYLENTKIVKYYVNIFENNLTKNSWKSVDYLIDYQKGGFYLIIIFGGCYI